MYLIITSFIISTIISVLLNWWPFINTKITGHGQYYWDPIQHIFLTIVGIIAFTIIITLFALCLIAPFNNDWVVKSKKTTNIHSLKNATGTYGNLTLGTGKINNKQYFMYTVKDKYGYKIKKIMDNGNVSIIADGKRILEEITLIPKSKWLLGKKKEYVFHIPTNEILLDFEIK